MRCTALTVALLLAVSVCGAAGRGLQHRSLAAAAAGQCTTMPLGWNVLLRTGETSGTKENVLGLQIDDDNESMIASMEPQPGQEAGKPAVSTQPDFTSLLKAPDGGLWVVTQFESPQPSVVYLMGVEQDKESGKLTPTSLEAVDFSEWGGVWTTCAGSVTPWGSHFGGEEYEPDARMIAEATSMDGEEETSLASMDSWLAQSVKDYVRYWDLAPENATLDEIRAVFNPYLFGWTFEVSVQSGGKYEAKKWYPQGRSSKELAYMMPDNQTVYHTDDGSQVAFYKFVADKPSDMSAGTVYGAKATQTSAENGGAFDITWIELGNSTQDEIQAMIDGGITFPDIFDAMSPENGTCPAGYMSVNSGVWNQECLKLQAGMEKAAAFLETRRYLGMLGGTTEFSKWEGITFSPKRMEGYTAMSEIRYGMEDNMKKGEADDSYDVGSNNDVRVAYNQCGCVYVLEADESFSFTSMKALICGYANPNTTDTDNTCATASIANPDNISVMDEHDTLLIGEDAGDAHQNDAVFAYNLNTGNMTRIFTTVYGAETTSVYWYPDVNGFAYVMAVVQHPYLESDEDKLGNPFSEGLGGYIGYFTMPAAGTSGKELRFAEVPVPNNDETKSTNIGSPSVDVCAAVETAPTAITPEQE